MSDLLKRLRGRRIDSRSDDMAMCEAADEIDRLNAQALELCAEISGLRREREDFHMDYRMKCDKETKRLHVDNERLRETLNRYIKGVGDLATLANQPSAALRFTCLKSVGPDLRGCGLVFGSWDELKAHEETHQPSAATENPEAMYSPVAREGHAGASARQIDVAAGDQLVAGQPERCCLDYPRCDCNSPPEPDNTPALQPCGHPWKAQHDSKCILCSSPGVTP